MKKICVLSGKGGVGKSTIAAALAVLLSEKKKIICADCDVDASNLSLVLGVKEKDLTERKEISTGKKAEINQSKCISCGVCKETCYFGAIDEENNSFTVNQLKCEGCGACALACPQKAIKMNECKNALLSVGETKYGFKVVSGQLKMGESGSGKIVAEVKMKAEKQAKNSELMLIDSAAGIGCPVIASVTGSDFVLAVTEPTPSGLSDLTRALTVVAHFGVPFGLVINKHDLNPEKTREITDFAINAGAKFTSLIPYDRAFVDSLIELKPVTEFDPKTREYFTEIEKKIVDLIK